MNGYPTPSFLAILRMVQPRVSRYSVSHLFTGVAFLIELLLTKRLNHVYFLTVRTKINIDDLVYQCSKFMSQHYSRLNIREREQLDALIEKYEATRTLTTTEIAFLESLHRRAEIE